VTYDYNLSNTVSHLMRFAQSLCQNFSVLQARGHPKWREVSLNLPALGPGWTYYPPPQRDPRLPGRTKAKRRQSPRESARRRSESSGFCD